MKQSAYIKEFEFLWHADDYVINDILFSNNHEIALFRKQFDNVMNHITRNFILKNTWNRTFKNAISLDMFIHELNKTPSKRISGSEALNEIFTVYKKMVSTCRAYEHIGFGKAIVGNGLEIIETQKDLKRILGYTNENRFKIYNNEVVYFALALLIRMDEYNEQDCANNEVKNSKKDKNSSKDGDELVHLAYSKNGTFNADLVYEYLYRRTLKSPANFRKHLYKFDTYTNILLMYLSSELDIENLDEYVMHRYLYTLYKYEKETKLISFFHYLNLINNVDFNGNEDNENNKESKNILKYVFPGLIGKINLKKVNIENVIKSIFKRVYSIKSKKSSISNYNNLMRMLILNMENSLFLKLVLMDAYSKFIDLEDNAIKFPNDRAYRFLDKLIISAEFTNFNCIEYNNKELIAMAVQVLCDYWEDEDIDNQLDRIKDYINKNDVNLKNYDTKLKHSIVFRFFDM